MRSLRIFVVSGLVLLWSVAPVMACLSPGQALTPDEMACCKKMAGACAGAPESHPCCKPTVASPEHPAVTSEPVKFHAAVDVAAAFAASPVFAKLAMQALPAELAFLGSSPPGPPGSASLTILRI